MERIVAVKKLGKMLGKGFGYQINPKAPSAEEREEAKQQLRSLSEAKLKAKEAMDARREAVLAADQQYQEMVAAWKNAKHQHDKAFSMTHSYKFTVGETINVGGFGMFHVKASGDSWEDVITKLADKAA